MNLFWTHWIFYPSKAHQISFESSFSKRVKLSKTFPINKTSYLFNGIYKVISPKENKFYGNNSSEIINKKKTATTTTSTPLIARDFQSEYNNMSIANVYNILSKFFFYLPILSLDLCFVFDFFLSQQNRYFQYIISDIDKCLLTGWRVCKYIMRISRQQHNLNKKCKGK